MAEVEIKKILYGVENWSINKDGLVDVNGDVKLNFKGLTKLPLQFGRVTGNFDCYGNDLTTLEGAPREVGDHFDCSHNYLIAFNFRF